MMVTSTHSQCLRHFVSNFSKLNFDTNENKPVLTNSTSTATNTAFSCKHIFAHINTNNVRLELFIHHQAKIC